MNFFSLEVITTIYPILLSCSLGLIGYKIQKGNLGIVIAIIISIYLLVLQNLITIRFPIITSSDKVIYSVFFALIASSFLYKSSLKKSSVIVFLISAISLPLIGYKIIENAIVMEDDLVYPITLLILVVLGLSIFSIITNIQSKQKNISLAVSLVAICLTYGTLALFKDLGTASATMFVMGSVIGGYCLINWIWFYHPISSLNIVVTISINAFIGQILIFEENLNYFRFSTPLLMILVPKISDTIVFRILKNRSERTKQIITPIFTGGICLVIGGTIMYFGYLNTLVENDY